MMISPRVWIAVVGLGLLIWANADFLPARHLPCAKLSEARGQAMCQLADKNLPFTVTGHDTFSPGWKPDFQTVKTVYCMLGVSAQDQPALDEMSRSADWRLRMVADALSALLDPRKAPQTIFDPAYGDNYLLKGGCPKAATSAGSELAVTP